MSDMCRGNIRSCSVYTSSKIDPPSHMCWSLDCVDMAPFEGCTYNTVPCPTCKHVSGQPVIGSQDFLADAGLGGSTGSGLQRAQVWMDTLMVDSGDDPDGDITAGQPTPAHRCPNHQFEVELYVCLPTLIDMLGRLWCRLQLNSATSSLTHTE